MLFSKPTSDQATALAAVFYCCYQVHQLAQRGNMESADLEIAVNALLNQTPSSADTLFGGRANLTPGSEVLKKVLDKQRTPELEQILHYALAILHLERRLEKSPKMLDQIANGITQARRQAEHFSPTHDNVVSNLASLYQDTLSTFSYRIQVRGNPDHLHQKMVAAKIRCLLFSAVRCAWLWRQLGGKRHHLVLFNRRLATLLSE